MDAPRTEITDGPIADGDRHVVPVTPSDDQEHAASPTCWCQPIVDYENVVTGARVYVHRRYMDGPVYVEKSKP